MRAGPQLLLEVVWLCAGGALLGLALNAASPHASSLREPVYPSSASGAGLCDGSGPSGSGHGAPRVLRSISEAEAVAACGSCAVAFVDARGAAAFAEGHLPGAVHLSPAGHGDEQATVAPLRSFPTVVVYDDGAGCGFAVGVAQRLQEAGLKDVRVLDGGWSAWMASGGPAESGSCNTCGSEERR